METWYYIVKSIDGDYANLKRTDTVETKSNRLPIYCLLVLAAIFLFIMAVNS